MWRAVITFADRATFYLFYVVTSEEAVLKYKLTPLARLVGYGVAGCEPTIMGIGPVPAISKSMFCFSFNLFNVFEHSAVCVWIEDNEKSARLFWTDNG